jgi:single-stranded DNA-binding protein
VSLFVLVVGTLISAPQRRTSNAGAVFATATVRLPTDTGTVLVSTVAFNARADELLRHQQGEAIAVAGRAKFTSWTAKDGAEKHGLSVVVEQIASASAARRADADRRRERKNYRDTSGSDASFRNEVRR